MRSFGKKMRGYTIIEVLVVVTLIGILSALGYASLNDAIQMSRAKDNARNMTAFVERALMEGKRKNIEIVIKCVNTHTEVVVYNKGSEDDPNSTPLDRLELLGGFKCHAISTEIETKQRIGLSNAELKPGSNSLIACNNNDVYCAAATKKPDVNHFVAQTGKGSASILEDLK